MKHSGTAALLISALIISCNRFDRFSPIGSGVIEELDSSAVTYDGTYYTEKYIPSGDELLSISDSLSGLHRYQDSLSSRKGSRQTEVIIGQFEGEESFGYLSFYPYLKIDTLTKGSPTKPETLTVRTPGRVVDSLLAAGKDSVTTALTFSINSKKNSEKFYNIELMAGKFAKDSAWIDTAKTHSMQKVMVAGDASKHTVVLPYHFYQAKEAETLMLTKISGEMVTTWTDSVKITKVIWKNGVMTTADSIAPIVSKSDTLRFSESAVRHHSLFSGFGISADSTAGSKGSDLYWSQNFFRTNSTGGKDTLVHRWKTDTAQTVSGVDSILYYDFISFPKKSSQRIDTAKSYDGKEIDSLYMIYDTTSRYSQTTVVQQGVRRADTVTFSRAYTKGETVPGKTTLDTLNIILKNVSKTTNSLFHMQSAELRIIGHKGTARDTVTIAPNRSTMSVFSTKPQPSAQIPFISGGTERMARLKVNTLPFWNMMNQNNYMSIVETNIQIPVDTVLFPSYTNSKMSVRYFISSKMLSPGAVLASSGTGKTAVLNQDSAYLKLNLTDYLIDQYYTDASSTPESWLYIWIDGSDMGQITLDRTKEYLFTYIVQNKRR